MSDEQIAGIHSMYLTGIMVYFRGNHPQMAELFRLMKHSNLPRCIMIGIVHDWIMIIQWTHYWTIVQVSRFFVFGENTFFFRSAEFPELFFFSGKLTQENLHFQGFSYEFWGESQDFVTRASASRNPHIKRRAEDLDWGTEGSGKSSAWVGILHTHP